MLHKKFLTELAVGAGRLLLKYLNKTHRIEHKPQAGIVTEADKAAEAYLIKKIFRKYPNSSIITEESGEYHGTSEYTWVLDPLDGTTNYAHGFPWFCVSIGLYRENKGLAGIVWNPVTQEQFYAEAGKGAFLNGKRIRVSKVDRLSDALVGTGFYYMRGTDLRREMAVFTRMNERALGVRRPGSAALDLAYVACGRYDGFWERGLSSWDVAAGFLLVQEAGGTISDFAGKTTDIFSAEVVASNRKLHASLVRVIKR